MIRCECPHCAQLLELTDEYAGRVATCQHCGRPLTAPVPALTPPPVPIAPPTAYASPQPSDSPGTSGLAIASLALGVTAFLCAGPLCAIPGVITGHMALSEIRKSPRRVGGKGMATTGLILGYINIAVVALLLLAAIPASILLPSLANAREAACRQSCQNNLKQMGIVFKMFDGENKDRFPELSADPGSLIFANTSPTLGSVYPEYLTDFTVLTCPSDDQAEALPSESGPLDAQARIRCASYTYLGYVVTNETELAAFVKAYKARIAAGRRFDEDLEVVPGTGSGGGDKILRIREGIERELVKDLANPAIIPTAQASIPIMWDRLSFQPDGKPEFNHIPGGANVLFMDGHVEFVKYPGRFPVTEKACRLLSELQALRAP